MCESGRSGGSSFSQLNDDSGSVSQAGMVYLFCNVTEYIPSYYGRYLHALEYIRTSTVPTVGIERCIISRPYQCLI